MNELAPYTALKRAVDSGSDTETVRAANQYVELIEKGAYNKTTPFTPSQDAVIRIMFNRCEPEELTEWLNCSMSQLITRARQLSATNQEDGMTAQDFQLMEACLDDGMSVETLCSTFYIEPPVETASMNNIQRANAHDAAYKFKSQGTMV